MSVCPAYKPSGEVRAFLLRNVITAEKLHDMVAHAAPFTHDLGNRRYHEWVFRVMGMEVVAVTNLRTCRSSLKDVFFTHDTCEACEGHGCFECEGEGTLVRARLQTPRPAHIGVMQ